MKGILGVVGLAVVAIIAVGATGCISVYDVSDKAKYDQLYAQAPAQAKYTFDVPYIQIKYGQWKCDSSFITQSLKEVYGDAIVFRHTTNAYVVDFKGFKSAGFATLFNGYKTATEMVADITMNENTREVEGLYHFKQPQFYDAEKVYEICYGSSLDLAKKIKAITDAGK